MNQITVQNRVEVDPFTLLPVNELVAMHDAAIERFGGRPGLMHPDCPEKTIANAWQAELYVEAPTPGLTFAGYLLFYFPSNHCFFDGNKRSGWMSCMRVLQRFDLTVVETTQNVYEFVTEIAKGHSGSIKNGAQVVEWLAARLAALSPAQ